MKAYICDRCGKREARGDAFDGLPPRGWYTLYHCDPPYPTFHLCGPACLAAQCQATDSLSPLAAAAQLGPTRG